MKSTPSFLKTSLMVLVLLAQPAAARQEVAALSGRGPSAPHAGGLSAAKAEELRARAGSLKKRRSALRAYLTTVAADSADSVATRRALAELDERLKEISSLLGQPAADDAGAAGGFTTVGPWAGAGAVAAGRPQAAPDFFLSRPVDRKPDESVQPTLAWTEDRAGLATKYIVEISTDLATNPDGTFVSTVFRKEVDPKGVAGQSITLGDDEKLEPGVTYYWHVLARYTPAGGGAERLQLSKRGRNASDTTTAPRTFRTAFNLFQRAEDKGFTLQRAFAGDDATEGAQFSFLRTFNKGTVYTTNFALIHNHDFAVRATWAAATQFSVEGALTSDESDAEDAWRFRGGVIIDRGGRYGTEALIRDQVNRGLADQSKLRSLRGFYVSLAAKMEADQDFDTRKLAFEGLFVPTVAALNMGATTNPDAASDVQFRWRPYFGIDAGHTFRSGDSSEQEKTILRLVPRVRPVLYLNFLRNALGFKNTYLYADNTFWFLPLEKGKRRHNFFTSGFNLDVTQNFGFGLTYKNGESAPKFKRVNTLGGVLTVRFGKED